jgi:hypothetical protein
VLVIDSKKRISETGMPIALKKANGFGRQFMEAGERRRGVKASLLLF